MSGGGFFGRYRVTADPLRSERRVELVVVLLLLLLGLIVVWQGLRLARLSAPEMVPPAPDSLELAELALPPGPDAAQRAGIRARPLFWASRTPSRVPTAAEELARQQRHSASQPLNGVKLVGVFGAGESAGIIAIVNGKKRRLSVGEEVNGWKLGEVSSIGARFSSGGREETLMLVRSVPTAAPEALREAVKPATVPPPGREDGLKSFGNPG